MVDKDEAHALLQRCIDLLEEMKDVAMGHADPDKGKVFWPIKEGDCPNINDAYATLYSLSDANLELTFYDETGNKWTDMLSMTFMNIYGDPDQPTYFARRPLKAMLEEELQIYIDEHNADCRPARLLARLVKAFEDDDMTEPEKSG